MQASTAEVAKQMENQKFPRNAFVGVIWSYAQCLKVGNDHIWKWWEEVMIQEIDSLSYQIQYNIDIMTRFRERTPLPSVCEPIDDVRRLEDELLLTDLELCDLKARVKRQEKVLSSTKKKLVMVGIVGLLVLLAVTGTRLFL
ncbi:unnamed protein product [Cochlearia groenlandica]